MVPAEQFYIYKAVFYRNSDTDYLNSSVRFLVSHYKLIMSRVKGTSGTFFCPLKYKNVESKTQ